MTIESQILELAILGRPRISLLRALFTQRKYETLFKKNFYDANLIFLQYQLESYSCSQQNSNNILRGFGGITYRNIRLGNLMIFALNPANNIKHWAIEYYSERNIRPLTPAKLEEQAEFYGIDIAKTCKKVAVIDCPKRGFKEHSFTVCSPSSSAAGFCRTEFEIPKDVKNIAKYN